MGKKEKEKDEIFISDSFIERLRKFEETTVTQLRELGDTTNARTEWFKLGKHCYISIVGKETLMWGGGCHLLLYDTVAKKDYVYMVNSDKTGDGVDCYTGHHSQNLLAFSENSLCPRIFVLKSPTFETICEIHNGAPEGYKSLNFASNEYLLALSYQPYYNLYIWNWRTKEKLYIQATDFFGINQGLKSSSQNPILVSQTDYSSTAIQIWEVQPFYKRCLFTKHKLKMPTTFTKIAHVMWSPDGSFFILEMTGSVYQCSGYPMEVSRVIKCKVQGPSDPQFCWYKDGIMLLNRGNEIKHYNRTISWEIDMELKPRWFKQLLVLKDTLCGWHRGRLYEIDIDNQVYKMVINLTSDTVDFEFIYPLGEVFVTYSIDNELQTWDVKTGKHLCMLQYEDVICSIGSNPRYPYVAVGLKIGVLQFVSAVNPKDLKVITEFHLSTTAITKIRFNREGNVIVAAHLLYGIFFVLCGLPGEKISVLSYINYRRTTIDFCIVEMTTQYYIYLLVQRGNSYSCSKKIVVKMISKLDGKVKKKLFESKDIKYDVESLMEIGMGLDREQNSESYYSQSAEFFSGLCAYNDVLYTIPYQSRHIRVVNLEHRRIKTVVEHATGHFLRKIYMNVGDYHVSTWGYDGLITLRTIDLKELLAAFSPHHRCREGVVKSITSPTLKYTISIGRWKGLACTNLVDLEEDPALLAQLQKDFEEQCQRFHSKTIGFIPDLSEEEGGFQGKNYVDYLNRATYLAEERAANAVKIVLRKEFAVLKAEVVELLEANLTGPELEKIDILEFYLYSRMRKHKEALTNFECEWTRRWSKQMIEAQDKVAEWIKVTFWYTMELKKTLLHGIFSNFAVENYILLPPKKGERNNYDILLFRRRAEELVRANDAMYPWVPASNSFLAGYLAKVPAITERDERLQLVQVLEENEEDEEADFFLKQRKATYGGSSSHKYIETCPLLYLPAEIHTFYQASIQIQLLQEDENNLRLAFNKFFDDLMSAKVREMQTIVERNDRLRYILSELNQPYVYIEDPKWHFTEKPESLTVVEPWEVSITPYISPSQQAILDAEAAEAERIRLALLADDFRERALMDMMYGVLEIRWEDIIKKDIPKPKCMLEKDPDMYTEEDIKACLDYDKKVAFLISERARYKNMLEAEYQKISENLKESMKKFNSRLRELLLQKLKMESCRLQEELKVQRLQAWCQERIEYNAKEAEALRQIKLNEEGIKEIQHNMVKLQEGLNEVKGGTEAFATKEKQLERAFKKELTENSSLVQAQAAKLYKKNPRVGTKLITSASLLRELASCIVSKERTILLTQECLDYLRSTDNLDNYAGVPNTIDEALYKTICKHRRLRLENELRVKAASVDQAEIENIIVFLQKRLSMKKETATRLSSHLEKVREDSLKHQLNKQIVIIMPQGLVEIPISGKESDLKNAAMVRRQDVEEINAIILKAGARKLKVMTDKMLHRRGILLKEWQHRHMTMEIEDLQTKLNVVLSVKVTKEIQDYLRKRAKGVPPDKGQLTLDQEIAIIKASYERIILGKKVKIEELEGQIKDFLKKNSIIDKKIAEINIDVCEQHLNRDLEFEKQMEQSNKTRMGAIVKRGQLVKQIQEQHNEILVLQTELELLRLKTYPTLKFKTLE